MLCHCHPITYISSHHLINIFNPLIIVYQIFNECVCLYGSAPLNLFMCIKYISLTELLFHVLDIEFITFSIFVNLECMSMSHTLTIVLVLYSLIWVLHVQLNLVEDKLLQIIFLFSTPIYAYCLYFFFFFCYFNLM